MATDFEDGVLVGLLIGEGHFGGDGRQPQISLRMHERHLTLFHWLQRTYPGGRLYGPYEHGGRRYYQWMVRGSYLRDELVPLLRDRLEAGLDEYARGRFLAMIGRYARRLGTRTASTGHQESVPPRSGSALRRPRRGGPAAADPTPYRARAADVAAIFAALRSSQGVAAADDSAPDGR